MNDSQGESRGGVKERRAEESQWESQSQGESRRIKESQIVSSRVNEIQGDSGSRVQ